MSPRPYYGPTTLFLRPIRCTHTHTHTHTKVNQGLHALQALPCMQTLFFEVALGLTTPVCCDFDGSESAMSLIHIHAGTLCVYVMGRYNYGVIHQCMCKYAHAYANVHAHVYAHTDSQSMETQERGTKTWPGGIRSRPLSHPVHKSRAKSFRHPKGLTLHQHAPQCHVVQGLARVQFGRRI